MFKRIFSLVMCIVLFFSVGIVANAESSVSTNDSIIPATNYNEIQPYYSYANTVTTTLRNSSGKAQCLADVVGFSNSTTKITITMTLQKKTLLWWSKVEEWTTTVSNYYATLSKTYTVESGKYRVKSVYTVYSGSENETITDYSSTVEF